MAFFATSKKTPKSRGRSLRPPAPEPRRVGLDLLVDADHLAWLTRTIDAARVSVWITTANLKTMLVEARVGTRARARGTYVSFFEHLAELARGGVDVRILHAAPPSGPLKTELARLGRSKLKLRQCPRVHLKTIAVDGASLYIGSANLTGAGLGAKGAARRNFELGIVTDDDATLDVVQARFDRIWRGRECDGCGLRRQCPAPIADLPR